MTDPQNALDHLLNGYLDDELNEAERTELEAMMLKDERIGLRLEELAQANSEFIESANEVDSVPMTESLSALMDRLSAEESQAAFKDETDNVITFPIWRKTTRFIEHHRAIAAALIMGVGAVVLQPAFTDRQSQSIMPGTSGIIMAQSQLGDALETLASGSVVEGDGVRIEHPPYNIPGPQPAASPGVLPVAYEISTSGKYVCG